MGVSEGFGKIVLDELVYTTDVSLTTFVTVRVKTSLVHTSNSVTLMAHKIG